MTAPIRGTTGGRTRLSFWPIGLALVLAIGGLFGRRETIESTYATYAKAEAAGAVERGWIPPFVPASATEIEEAHDLDTNGQRLRFRAPAADLQAMVEGMQPLSREAAERMAAFPHAPDPAAVIYRDTSINLGGGCVAIDARQGKAYAWTCGSQP